jgi:hypothetical protein
VAKISRIAALFELQWPAHTHRKLSPSAEFRFSISLSEIHWH